MKKDKRKGLLFVLLFLVIILAVCGIVFFVQSKKDDKDKKESSTEVLTTSEEATTATTSEPVADEEVNTESDATNDYYQPDDAEIARAAELKGILVEDLPRMDGSTSTIPLEGGIRASLFDISQVEAEESVVHSTTYGSFDNLMQDNCDIIFSTPLSQAQMDTAAENNIELELVPIVYEGFVFVVNASNPVDTLTQQQIKDIYSGKITNWKEVGGNDAEIVAYQRNATSGSQNYMTMFMEGSELMEPKTDFIPGSMVGLMDAVATYDNAENAIGYSVYAYAADMYGNGNEIKFIKVDGVEPTKATMASKEYPLLNYNYAIYNKAKAENTNVDELCEWLLTYDGQVAMVNAGYIPVKNIKIEEGKITPYTKKGTGVEKNADFVIEPYKYVVDNRFYVVDDKITGLNDKELQDEINAFIDDSKSKLESKKEEFIQYLELKNEGSEYPIYQVRYEENSDNIYVEAECINGYLSVQVDLRYEFAAGAGTQYTYDGYSVIYDLYTGETMELSDLYFKDTDFISVINDEIKYFENHTPELSPERSFKGPFVSVPEVVDMYSLQTIGFKKNNPYFTEGEIFKVEKYEDAVNKVIYQVRDMEGIWDDTITVEKWQNRLAFEHNYTVTKEDKYIYGVQIINTGNADVDKKINDYIQNYVSTELTPDKINEYIANDEAAAYYDSSDEIPVDVRAEACGTEVIIFTIGIDMGNTYSELFFDLKTGEIIENMTRDEFWSQYGM